MTYPYLRNAPLAWQATLATLAIPRNSGATTELITFRPVRQLDDNQYSAPLSYKVWAAQAALYATIARAIGVARDVPALSDVPIDAFWDVAKKAAVWGGAVREHAAIGALLSVAGQALGSANVKPVLDSDKAAILTGTYTNAAGAKQRHWVLATSYTLDSQRALKDIVANDPWTGTQVKIDPVSKLVVSQGFPLTGFTVDGYQVVFFKRPPTS